MKAGRRVAAACVCLALLVPLGVITTSSFGASAQDDDAESVVREVVVSVLDPNGEVRKTRVAQLVRVGGGGEVRIPDDEDVLSYRTLSGFGGPGHEDGDLVWRSDTRRDAVVLAEVSKELPLEVRASYTLDGEAVTADELKGEKGRVGIELDLENVSAETKTITYDAMTQTLQTSSVPTYMPLEYTVVVSFPSDWRDLEAEHAYVETNAHGDQIVVKPGLLSPPLTPARDAVRFEATSDNITLPGIKIAAFARVSPEGSSVLDAQVSGLGGLYGGLGEISTNLNALYEGTLKIVDGVEALVSGVGELDATTKAPVITLDSAGTPTTLLGTLGFIRNAIRNQMLPGLGERDKATGEPKVTLDANGDPTTVLGALGFVGGAVTDRLLPAIGERDPVTGRAVETYFDDKHVDSTLLWGLQSSKDTYDEQLIPAMDQLTGGIDALIAGLRTFDPQNPGLVDALEQLGDGLGAINGKLDTLGAGQGFRESLLLVKNLAAAGLAQTTDPTAAGLFQFIGLVADGLLAGLGNRNADGSPNIVLDGDGNPATIIGGIGFIQAVLGQQVLPGIGDLNEATKKPIVTLDADGKPTTLLGALGFIRYSALVNPEFTKPQASLDGKTPKEYRQECPACWDPRTPLFDPKTADPRIQPGLRDAFVLFSEGLEGGLEGLQTFDDGNPGLVEGLRQIGEGLQTLTTKLHTFNAKEPGLVDGLQQLEAGVETLTSKLHTFDPANPGLVDGLQQVRGGVQQVSSGVFAINELGVRIARGNLGETGDQLSRDVATLKEQQKEIQGNALLAQGASEAFTTYVFDIPAQSSTGRDNAARAGMIGFGILGVVLLGRRPFGVF